MLLDEMNSKDSLNIHEITFLEAAIKLIESDDSVAKLPKGNPYEDYFRDFVEKC